MRNCLCDLSTIEIIVEAYIHCSRNTFSNVNQSHAQLQEIDCCQRDRYQFIFIVARCLYMYRRRRRNCKLLSSDLM